MTESNTITDIRDRCRARLTVLVNSYDQISAAIDKIEDASIGVGVAWKEWMASHIEDKTSGLDALHVLMMRERTLLSHDMLASAEQLGKLVARGVIVPVARESGEQAVVAMTGNSYVPSLRSLDDAEEVWQTGDPDVWQAFVEAVERTLDEEGVIMFEPDYDNALFVVDVRRFEIREDADDMDPTAHVDNDNWIPREPMD